MHQATLPSELILQMSNNKSCLNCEAPLMGDFCHQCGQKASVSRITFTETLRDFLSGAFSFEGLLVKTVRDLLIRPGVVFTSFIAGKRKRYYKPVSFYLLMTAIYLLVRAGIGYNPIRGKRVSMQGVHIDEQTSLTLSTILRKAGAFMLANVNYVMFFLVFAIALMFRLLFRKNYPYNLAEYSSAGLYIVGIYVMLSVPLMILSHYSGVSSSMQMVFLCIALFYMSYPFAKGYGLIKRMIFCLLASFGSILLYILLGFGL